jgi:triphosphatase
MSVIGLQSTQSLTQAGCKVFAHHFHDLTTCEREVRFGDDIEAVHDMRVATRRFRAAIHIFAAGFSASSLKFLQKGLKQTAKMLGKVRDLDVFLEKLRIYQQQFPLAEQTELAPLLEYFDLQREIARTKLLSYLESAAYEKFKTKTTHFLQQEHHIVHEKSHKPTPFQIAHIAPALIYKRYEAIRVYEPFLIDASAELLHQLRIDFKHFRYTLENFHDILGGESAVVLADVKKIQNHLGDLNDARVACELLQDFLQHWKQYRKKIATTRAKKPISVIDYLNVKLAEKELLSETFPQAWHHFNSNKLRLNLALSIAVI